MRPPTLFVSILGLTALAALTARAALTDAWKLVPATVVADSLPGRFREMEVQAGRGAASGAAAFSLGQYHFARGEYAQALRSFGRAAGRTGGSDRGEVRYWEGLCHLALARPGEARTAFEDAARSTPSRRTLARLGVAQALETEGRAPMAFDELRRLLAADPGEAGPAALAAWASLADRMKRPEDARQARVRLLREYPASVEAARLAAAPLAPAAPAGPGLAGFQVQLGAFAELARAHALAESARAAGFSAATVNERPAEPGQPRLYVVRLGSYTDEAQARAVLQKAERALGVSGRLEGR